MPLLHRFEDIVQELQQLEHAASNAQGSLILEVFTRHTPFELGALYLRDRDAQFRLSAKSPQLVAPEILQTESHAEGALEPSPGVVVPLRNSRENFGVLALARGSATEDDLAFVRAASTLLSVLLTNHRLVAEKSEGELQLKYRLLELESLYDIGLSIASTLNIDELAEEIIIRTISLMNARRVALYLRQGDGFKLHQSIGEARELDPDLAARLVFEGEPVSFEGGADCLFPDCSTFVAVPIRGNNNVIGVLAAADRETREGGIAPFEKNELQLLSMFANQVAIALENARLHRDALEKQAMEQDLKLAATIQRDILPRSIPVIEGLELAALSRPARQVGGDYHAFFEQEGIVTMLLADVAGKSMPAALLVSALHAAVQLLFAEGHELGEIATDLNRHIHKWSAENKFITMVMVSIDREHETLRFVNAGHNPCYIMHGDRLETIKSHGLPIGILGQTRYMTQTRPFPAGSAVVLYSDGITEAENEEGEEFENPRLEEILTANAGASAAELRDRIAAAVDAFVGEAPQKDDQTLVISRM